MIKFTPHPFQQAAIEHIESFLRTATPGDKRSYAAPTGCGKSIIELYVKENIGPACYIVSPREEIIDGMCDKAGVAPSDAEAYGIYTPIRLRNLLLKGEAAHPTALILDEGHHAEAESWQELDLLTGMAPSVLLTATPYRGSPRSTRALHDRFGEPIWIITLQEAASMGYVTLPSFEILPLVDDDIVDVSGGEFSITSIDSATVDRLGDMAEHAKRWYNGTWDVPTIFAMPSTACCVRLQQEMLKRGLPCAIVNAATKERQSIFEATRNKVLALLHINIVTEGVDLPLRRLVDLAPTLSPVKWVQQLGRITRPTSDRPQYVCTNRNILRHAYALEGAVPVSAIVETEAKFGPTERAHSRALGLEALGRFKPAPAKLLSGAKLYVYSLSTVVDSTVIEYCCLVHPTMEPIWASKVNTVVDGVKKYGSWQKCDAPNDVRGFSSVGAREPSEKQLSWWKRSAHRFGLDNDEEPNRRSFQALPVLSDTGRRLC